MSKQKEYFPFANKLMGLEPDCGIIEFMSWAITVKKNNSDEWMIGLVKRANAMFLKAGDETRLRYKNGEIEQLIC